MVEQKGIVGYCSKKQTASRTFSDYEKNALNFTLDSLHDQWKEKIQSVFEEANLSMPAEGWMQSGGKTGKHTEHIGYLLAEMQVLQRTFPNATW